MNAYQMKLPEVNKSPFIKATLKNLQFFKHGGTEGTRTPDLHSDSVAF